MKKPQNIVAREEEKQLLNRIFHSSNPEFLAVYGRRRVGKTFLIRNFFRNKGFFFEITGSIHTTTRVQLDNFHAEYSALFDEEKDSNPPKTWREAFRRLKKSLETIKSNQKIILFFDELPWLASPRSGFLSALDYFWNRHLSDMPNVLLIVSGSAASWMIKNVINNTGGLYGRLSAQLRLLPFTLAESKEYLEHRGISLSLKQVTEIYMVTGGVPKYLSYLEPGLSSTQNIHKLCFTAQSPLLTEFYKLYTSLFQKAEAHMRIVRILADKRHGMARGELIKQAKLTISGRTSQVLQELEESGFISAQRQIGKIHRNIHYYLSDEYTFFYLNWIEEEKSSLLNGVEKDYWIKRHSLPKWKSWSGFAFETLCLKHESKIKDALKIGGVATTSGYWQLSENGKKQIEVDLVIERADQCINLCEIKFHQGEFTVTKVYAQSLAKKKHLFCESTQTKSALFTTLITPFGMKDTPHAQQEVDHQITLEDLF